MGFGNERLTLRIVFPYLQTSDHRLTSYHAHEFKYSFYTQKRNSNVLEKDLEVAACAVPVKVSFASTDWICAEDASERELCRLDSESTDNRAVRAAFDRGGNNFCWSLFTRMMRRTSYSSRILEKFTYSPKAHLSFRGHGVGTLLCPRPRSFIPGCFLLEFRVWKTFRYRAGLWHGKETIIGPWSFKGPFGPLRKWVLGIGMFPKDHKLLCEIRLWIGFEVSRWRWMAHRDIALKATLMPKNADGVLFS